MSHPDPATEPQPRNQEPSLIVAATAGDPVDGAKTGHGVVDFRHRMQRVVQAVDGQEPPRGDEARDVPVFAEGEHARDHVAGAVPAWCRAD